MMVCTVRSEDVPLVPVRPSDTIEVVFELTSTTSNRSHSIVSTRFFGSKLPAASRIGDTIVMTGETSRWKFRCLKSQTGANGWCLAEVEETLSGSREAIERLKTVATSVDPSDVWWDDRTGEILARGSSRPNQQSESLYRLISTQLGARGI